VAKRPPTHAQSRNPPSPPPPPPPPNHHHHHAPTAAAATISAADVKKLRTQTGAGMMDCKKALAENSGDFEKATEVRACMRLWFWLRSWLWWADRIRSDQIRNEQVA